MVQLVDQLIKRKYGITLTGLFDGVFVRARDFDSVRLATAEHRLGGIAQYVKCGGYPVKHVACTIVRLNQTSRAYEHGHREP